MRIGLSAYDMAAADLLELARAADELGFESLWLGEHVVLPVGYSSAHPTANRAAGTGRDQSGRRPIVDPSTRLLDPLVALGACGAVTARIHLGSAVFLAGLRPPLVAARMAHTAQQLCAGRLILGVGAGWLEEEFAAVGVPFGGRGRRLAETVKLMRKAWRGEPFSHRGEFFTAEQVQLCDRPIDIPVVMGGNSDVALERAAALGDGWMASGTPDPAEADRLRARLEEHLARRGRTGSFSLYTRVARPERDLVERYRRAGWDRILIWAHQVWPQDAAPDERRRALAAAARTLGVGREPESPSTDGLSAEGPAIKGSGPADLQKESPCTPPKSTSSTSSTPTPMS